MKFSLIPPPDFSYDLALSFLERSPRERLHRVADGKVFKALCLREGNVLFSIHQKNESLVIQILNHPHGHEIKNQIAAYVQEWFDWHTNLSPFYRKFQNDSLLGPLIKKYRGYRIVGQPDLFESLVWAVIGQQINLTFAYTLKQRFVETFGESVGLADEKYYLFPTPDAVSCVTAEQLLALQFSRQKAAYIIGLAQAFNSGAISKDYIRQLPLPQAKEKLMALKGIGNWTANYALMKTFRYPDAFPMEDAGLHNAIKNLKGMKSKPSLEQVKRIFRKYKGWEAYATLYLWKSLS
jgi:DNA-3-methyladenine glycosylase II